MGELQRVFGFSGGVGISVAVKRLDLDQLEAGYSAQNVIPIVLPAASVKVSIAGWRAPGVVFWPTNKSFDNNFSNSAAGLDFESWPFPVLLPVISLGKIHGPGPLYGRCRGRFQ